MDKRKFIAAGILLFTLAGVSLSPAALIAEAAENVQQQPNAISQDAGTETNAAPVAEGDAAPVQEQVSFSGREEQNIDTTDSMNVEGVLSKEQTIKPEGGYVDVPFQLRFGDAHIGKVEVIFSNPGVADDGTVKEPLINFFDIKDQDIRALDKQTVSAFYFTRKNTVLLGDSGGRLCMSTYYIESKKDEAIGDITLKAAVNEGTDEFVILSAQVPENFSTIQTEYKTKPLWYALLAQSAESSYPTGGDLLNATGVQADADANAILTKSLTREVIHQHYIDALTEIGKNGNLVVVPEGSTPMVDVGANTK